MIIEWRQYCERNGVIIEKSKNCSINLYRIKNRNVIATAERNIWELLYIEEKKKT